MNSPIRFPVRLAVAGLLCLAAGAVFAQSTPADAAARDRKAADADSAVTLSPFAVVAEKDDGYQAIDTVAGGRMSMNLLKTPTDTSVLTREFLDDVVALNTDDASKWLPSASVRDRLSETDTRDFGNQVTFRGLPSSGLMRNTFPFGITPDTYVVERMEAGRGGNSIIFAEAAGGGRTNISTKRAHFRNTEQLGFMFDTNGGRRATLDVNRKLNDKLALRLNLLGNDGRRWFNNYEDRKAGAHLAGTIRPTRTAEIRFEGEYLFNSRTSSTYVHTDTSSLWDRRTVVDGPLAANPVSSTGLSRFTTDYLVLSPSLPSIENFRNFARTNGTALTLSQTIQPSERPFNNFPALPSREFIATPKGSRLVYRPYTYSAFYEQKLPGNFFTEVAAFYGNAGRNGSIFSFTNSYIDVNRALPSGQPNPNFGKIYSEATVHDNQWTEIYAGYRVAGAYRFEREWVRQTISLVLERTEFTFNPQESTYARTKDPSGAAIPAALNNAANRPVYWRYWDNADAPFEFPRNRDGYEFTRYLTRDTGRETRTHTLQLATIGSYFHDRLNVVGGIRWDDYSADARTGLFDANGRRAGDTYSTLHTKPKTMSGGFSYFPIASAGVYASYNEGFQTQSNENPWLGEPIWHNTSRGYSAGIRLRLFDGRLVGSVGRYQTKIQNLLINTWTSSRSQVNEIWNDLNRGEMTLSGPFSVLSDTQDSEGHGWEAEFTANISQRLRLRLNASLPEASQQNSVPQLRAYYDEHIAEWQAGANDPDNPNRARIRTDIQNIENGISGFTDGRPRNGTYTWQGNIFATYQLQGALKGLRVGGGANVFGRRLIGNESGRPFDFIYADSYYVVTATAGYRFRVRQATVDLALNVSNALDYDEPLFNSVSVYQGVAYRNRFSYADPRKATLSATISF